MEFKEGELYLIGGQFANDYAYWSKVGKLMEYIKPVPRSYTGDTHVLRIPGSGLSWHIQGCDILPRKATTNKEALTLLREEL